MRTIKKYENRCLYDCETSSNISIQDLKQYILDGIHFKVINAKTEEDLTRQYLIQIILELEAMDTPLFTQQSLEQIIRFYASPNFKNIQQYLEQFLNMFDGQQHAWQNIWTNTQKN
jgi:polyhydroxyalkanoate synthesis repressor PhaR